MNVTSDQLRYLVAGVWNTIFGYGVGVGLYLLLSEVMHIAWIGLIANVLAITMSFTTYKLFVFRSRGHWFAEYLRSYVVYGSMALLGIVLLWLLVDGFHVRIWFAQGMVIVTTVVISYFGHARFTFRNHSA
jgi:putative flippase GtrA